MADIAARREVGIQRYGTALQAHNGRNARRDAYVEALRDAYDEALDLYDEALDLACHLRQLLEEQAGGD